MDGREDFIAIRYSSNLKNIHIQKLWCDMHGKNFVLKTEKEVRENNVYLENMKMLIPYINNRLCPIYSLENLLVIEPLRIKEAIFWLYYHGKIKAGFYKNFLLLIFVSRYKFYKRTSKIVYSILKSTSFSHFLFCSESNQTFLENDLEQASLPK
ncbi:hypothetical protein P4U97_17010 [Bacillus swezeyi]|uniref:hypothetical protein n=1 Tax=Bacillus swezeyi TaxID=1925020 RepID=UPI002E1E6C89|nr:hypothetical protein [Bacillus swezeyi]